MTLKDSLLPTVYSGRAIAGALGFRPHTAKLVFKWADPATGEIVTRAEYPIVEANNQPPRAKRKKAEDVPFGNAPSNTWDLGPITPAFPGGGTDITLFTRELEEHESRVVVLTGPECPEGEEFSILHVDQTRPLRAVVTIQGQGEALDGYTRT